MSGADQKPVDLPMRPGVYWYKRPDREWRIAQVFDIDGRLRARYLQPTVGTPLDADHFPAGDVFRGPLVPGWVCHTNVAPDDLKDARKRYAQRMTRLDERMQFCRQVGELVSALQAAPDAVPAHLYESLRVMPQIIDAADQHKDLMMVHGLLMDAERDAFHKEWAALNEQLAKLAGGAP